MKISEADKRRIEDSAKDYTSKQGTDYPIEGTYRRMIQSQIKGAFSDAAIREHELMLSMMEQLQKRNEELIVLLTDIREVIDDKIIEISELKKK